MNKQNKSRASLHPPPEGRGFTDFFGKKFIMAKVIASNIKNQIYYSWKSLDLE
ncbi:MAG: hypothetical protein U1D70_01400 [Methylobacter sp.]|nr:hypothetical protein [Methylobacter sp.]MDZ4217665.1 hypothetical protein [Methylobacter sp.]